MLSALEDVPHCMIQVDLVLVRDATRGDVVLQEGVQVGRAPVGGVLLPGQFQDRHWWVGEKVVFVWMICHEGHQDVLAIGSKVIQVTQYR